MALGQCEETKLEGPNSFSVGIGPATVSGQNNPEQNVNPLLTNQYSQQMLTRRPLFNIIKTNRRRAPERISNEREKPEKGESAYDGLDKG